MRNREQIYGQEAAGLLRNITVYHCMRRDQLLRLYPGKEGVIENLLRYLVKQQRIFYNTDRDCYGDVPDCREDRELTAALEVKAKSVVEIDDGLAPCFFFKTEEGYTRCQCFDADRARTNCMEDWEEYNQEDIK